VLLYYISKKVAACVSAWAESKVQIKDERGQGVGKRCKTRGEKIRVRESTFRVNTSASYRRMRKLSLKQSDRSARGIKRKKEISAGEAWQGGGAGGRFAQEGIVRRLSLLNCPPGSAGLSTKRISRSTRGKGDWKT